jgi:hypothetical protein
MYFDFFTPEELLENYKKFRKLINQEFSGERLDTLNKMYDHFEERIIYTPASSFEHFHNAFPGGYIDHILRVTRNALKVYELWKDLDMVTDDITRESVVFAALHHDLGKVGSVSDDWYKKNESEWHVKNQGKIYKSNPKLHWMEIHDRTFYLLNHFGVKCSEEEYLAIRLTDGLYDTSTESYYKSFQPENQLKTFLPHILHQADFMASKFEYNRWVTDGTKLKGGRSGSIQNGRPGSMSKFEKLMSTRTEEEKPKVDMVFDAFKDIMED